MERCSFPQCGYIADRILNCHTVNEHGLMRDQVIKQYGRIETIHPQFTSEVQTWINEQTPRLTIGSFHHISKMRIV